MVIHSVNLVMNESSFRNKLAHTNGIGALPASIIHRYASNRVSRIGCCQNWLNHRIATVDNTNDVAHRLAVPEIQQIYVLAESFTNQMRAN